MNDKKEKKYWFKAKKYGYGWYPSSWQGWVSTIFYTIALVLVLWGKDLSSDLTKDYFFNLVQIFSLTILLIALCYLTGEKPRWRWGSKD